MKLIVELTESRLISSKWGYRHFTGRRLAEMLYLHLNAFRILSCEDSSEDFLRTYAQKSKYWNSFSEWHQNANDLYLLVYGLSDPDIDLSKESHEYVDKLSLDNEKLMQWIKSLVSRNPISDRYARRLFLVLDHQLRIEDSSWKSIRRLAMNWPDLSHREKQLAMTRLLQLMTSRCPTSDLIAPLTKLAHHNDLLLKHIANRDEETRGLTLTQVAAQHKLAEDDGGAPPPADVSTTTSDIAQFVKPLMKVKRRITK